MTDKDKPFLYDILERKVGENNIKRIDLPIVLTDNLNPNFGVRPYQKEAFQRFIAFEKEDFEGKSLMPYHLLFNMATGSGKTLIMAGLILYLYEKGHRNFLFFVHTNTIIQKTKDNFLNSLSSKYLFNNRIVFDNKEIFLKEVENFEDADNENINICFTSIQKLHSRLNNAEEGSLTYEDLKDKKIVLIADEAHHFNVSTQSKLNFDGNWEDTILKIFNQNLDNYLLEFTATLDYEDKNIVEKYTDKVIFKYDLFQFRKDKYSKEIDLIRSYFAEKERMLQAVLLNQYRQELASQYGINLKPVILFKAKRTVAESELNKVKFHKLIDNLSAEEIERVLADSTVDIVKKAEKFFDQQGISYAILASRIQSNFKEENCISANSDGEAEANQLKLNTLEDDSNPIRAVFAVQKLNEGWDVLNLFDIVRLYEDRDGADKKGKLGKTTLGEAQLIGRGARYFPFSLDGEDKYTRKYDRDTDNDLKILEQLYYHTKEDSRYISEIKRALTDSGIYDDDEGLITKELKLKDSFKQTDFYKKGVVFLNEKRFREYRDIHSLEDFGVGKKDVVYTLSSGVGKRMNTDEDSVRVDDLKSITVSVSSIPFHITRYALTTNQFYYFESINKYFGDIKSTKDFIINKEYLGGLSIQFRGTEIEEVNLSNQDYLNGVIHLLKTIEEQMKAKITIFEGTTAFKAFPLRDNFKDKSLRIPKTDINRIEGQQQLLSNQDWYAYNANYGTPEETAFVKMFIGKFPQFKEKYEDVYLIRNERSVKIYDPEGRAFEPDFLLFVKQKDGEELTYQIFIEPKGSGYAPLDKWKEDFLKELRTNKQTIEFNTDHYLITGLPFYTKIVENDFKKEMDILLDL